MTNRNLIFLTGLIILILIFYILTAKVAKNKSDEILDKFKSIDSSLTNSNNNLKNNYKDSGSFEGPGQLSPNLNLAVLSNEIILYIDSLAEVLKNDTPGDSLQWRQAISQKNILILKDKIHGFNTLINSREFKAISRDSINLAGIKTGSRFIEWEKYYFTNVPRESAYTFLVYIKNRILKIERSLFR